MRTKVQIKQTKDKRSGDRKVKKKQAVRITSAVVLFLLLTLVLHQLGVFRFPWESSPVPVVAGDVFPGSGDAEDGNLSGMTEEEILEQMQKIADASQFSFKINAKPEFEDGRSTGNLRIENPSYNVYPMVVQITLDETGEIIYDSGGLMPDQHIDNARLSKVLVKGTYSATAHLYAYDPDTMICQGESAARLTITINN